MWRPAPDRAAAVAEHPAPPAPPVATGGRFLGRLAGAGGTAVQFSPDGARLLTAGGNEARVWDAATLKPVAGPLRHAARVQAAAFSPDGRAVLTGSADGTARVWDAATGVPRTPPLEHGGPVTSAAFSPDGRTVVTVGEDKDRAIRTWDAATGRPVAVNRKALGQQPMVFVAYSPDGGRLLAVYDRPAGFGCLWDARTGEEVATLHALAAGAHARAGGGRPAFAAFSPDGRTIATIGGARGPRPQSEAAGLWDGRTGEPLAESRPSVRPRTGPGLVSALASRSAPSRSAPTAAGSSRPPVPGCGRGTRRPPSRPGPSSHCRPSAAASRP